MLKEYYLLFYANTASFHRMDLVFIIKLTVIQTGQGFLLKQVLNYVLCFIEI